MRTYQTRVALSADESARLDAYGSIFGRALRRLHAARRSGSALSKPQFMRDHDLTSRQFNAVNATLDGMECSIRELRPGQIADLKQRIDAVEKRIGKESNRCKIHHLKRRLQTLKDPIAQTAIR